MRPAGHIDRAQSLLNLANAYWTRFEHAGDVDDVDEAVRYDKQILELRPPGHPNRAAALRSLTTDLTARYRRTQQLSDLSRAIALQTETLQLHGGPVKDDVDEGIRGTTAYQLIAHLVVRYSIELKREDLERAAKLTKDFYARFKGRGQDFSSHVVSEVRLDLGNVPDDVEQLQEAVVPRRLLSESLSRHADLAISLAHALTEPHGRTGKVPSVEEAISRGTRPVI